MLAEPVIDCDVFGGVGSAGVQQFTYLFVNVALHPHVVTFVRDYYTPNGLGILTDTPLCLISGDSFRTSLHIKERVYRIRLLCSLHDRISIPSARTIPVLGND